MIISLFTDLDPELQRGDIVYPESHSWKEVEAGCELSLAEAEAHGLCATSWSQSGW